MPRNNSNVYTKPILYFWCKNRNNGVRVNVIHVQGANLHLDN